MTTTPMTMTGGMTLTRKVSSSVAECCVKPRVISVEHFVDMGMIVLVCNEYGQV